MSAPLQSAADAYIAARDANLRAEEAARIARHNFHAAEKSLLDSIINGPTVGEAVVMGGNVLLLNEEYWDLPAGSRITVRRLIADASEPVEVAS